MSVPSGAVEVAHIDDACLVAVKPSGMLSVPGRGEAGRDCLAARVQAEWPDALVVHRLDMSTSGLMLFARGAEMQRALSIAFADRRVGKRYVAVVDGVLDPAQGEIDLPLAADWPNRPKQRVDAEHGKPSLTRYCVVGQAADGAWSRVELEPVTGRAHQLRVHLNARGHAILGDALYASAPVLARAERLLLHATELDFTHPITGAAISVANAPPF